MNIYDILILMAIVIAVFFAIKNVIIRGKKGGCGCGCAECSQVCQNRK